MNTKPALAIIKSDGRTTTGATFDQETVEFAKLNNKVQQRRDAQNAKYEARQRRREYEWFCTMSFGYLVLRALLLVLVGILTADGVVPVWMSFIIAGYCVGSALIRVGRWIEKARNQ